MNVGLCSNPNIKNIIDDYQNDIINYLDRKFSVGQKYELKGTINHYEWPEYGVLVNDLR